jgi:hypothetical protein
MEAKVEIAIKAPETVSETDAERDLRAQAEFMFHETHPHGLCKDYEAGWKAAKAYYEVAQ